MNRDILEQIVGADLAGNAALCSVIEFKGSVPRKDYPIMVVSRTGASYGTIGGGGVEYDSVEEAKKLANTDIPKIVKFKLNSTELDENYGVCGGSLKVLIEPLNHGLWTDLKQASAQYDTPGDQYLVLKIDLNSPDQLERQIIAGDELGHHLPEKIRLEKPGINPQVQNYSQGTTNWLVYPLSEGPRLHIFGAGHVGQAIADLASNLELTVTVYDDREELLTEERFPHATRSGFDSIDDWKESPSDSKDFVVIASRGHRHDRTLLELVLQDPPAYTGLLASKRKWILMRQRMEADGFSPHILDRVHSPVGLDINAQTVPEIAVSILGEIIAEYRRE